MDTQETIYRVHTEMRQSLEYTTAFEHLHFALVQRQPIFEHLYLGALFLWLKLGLELFLTIIL